MSWIISTASFLEILLLLYVAATDVTTRLIRNEVCLALALLGILSQIASPMQVVQSVIAAAILLLLLLLVFTRGWMGGGDVKLLVALAVGLPLTGVVQLLTVTALAGGVLAARARRIVGSSPRLRRRALAASASRTFALWRRHRVRRHLDHSHPRYLTCLPPCVCRSLRCWRWQRSPSG